MPVIDPRWWQPARSTCSIWALGQFLRFGGRIKVIRNHRVRWLFRCLWSPDRGATWFAYVPDHPVMSPWHATLLHSLWFKGRPKRVNLKGK